MRVWRAANPEATRETSRRFEALHREERKARKRIWRRAHPVAAQMLDRRYRLACKAKDVDGNRRAAAAKRSRSWYYTHKEAAARVRRDYIQKHKAEIAEQQQRYQTEHKREIAAKRKIYTAAHKVEKAGYDRLFRAKTKNERIIYFKKYYREHNEELRAKQRTYSANHRATINAYQRRKRSTPVGKLIHNLRHRLYEGLMGRHESRRLFALVGKSPEQLMAYLLRSSKDPKITAQNYGSYWAVDHIVPVSFFDHTDFDQIAQCWSWRNLAPLEKIANIRKRDKIPLESSDALPTQASAVVVVE